MPDAGHVLLLANDYYRVATFLNTSGSSFSAIRWTSRTHLACGQTEQIDCPSIEKPSLASMKVQQVTVVGSSGPVYLGVVPVPPRAGCHWSVH